MVCRHCWWNHGHLVRQKWSCVMWMLEVTMLIELWHGGNLCSTYSFVHSRFPVTHALAKGPFLSLSGSWIFLALEFHSSKTWQETPPGTKCLCQPFFFSNWWRRLVPQHHTLTLLIALCMTNGWLIAAFSLGNCLWSALYTNKLWSTRHYHLSPQQKMSYIKMSDTKYQSTNKPYFGPAKGPKVR